MARASEHSSETTITPSLSTTSPYHDKTRRGYGLLCRARTAHRPRLPAQQNALPTGLLGAPQHIHFLAYNFQGGDNNYEKFVLYFLTALSTTFRFFLLPAASCPPCRRSASPGERTAGTSCSSLCETCRSPCPRLPLVQELPRRRRRRRGCMV